MASPGQAAIPTVENPDTSEQVNEDSSSSALNDVDGVDGDSTIQTSTQRSDSDFAQDEHEANFEEDARETRRTLRHIKAFLEVSKDKHYIDINLAPLTGPDNYGEWLVGMGVILRMHHVWELVLGTLVVLDEEDKMNIWLERMANTAVALIYAHLSAEIRAHKCIMRAVVQGEPGNLMNQLYSHFGSPDVTVRNSIHEMSDPNDP